MAIDQPITAFVWIWLPGRTTPVVAGRLDRDGQIITFTYARTYLGLVDRMALYLPELPLGSETRAPEFLRMPSCIADGAPDAWGRRVVETRLLGQNVASGTDLGDLVYLLESGSDRIGALDFQSSPIEYRARDAEEATVEELLAASEAIAAGDPISPDLERALLHGTAIGGARPKALLRDEDRSLIAKFSSSTDTFPNVKGEYVAMTLARLAGMEVAPVEIISASGKDVLLVDRFDRPGDDTRRAMVSARTMLRLTETGIGASYAELADLIRARFEQPEATAHELFNRMVFNILCGNTDDHPRNHAAFWDGARLRLTPAYDISPEKRPSWDANQAMAIDRDGRRESRLSTCVAAASTYLLSGGEARAIIDSQISVIRDHWDQVCMQADLSTIDAKSLWDVQFLHPFALEGY